MQVQSRFGGPNYWVMATSRSDQILFVALFESARYDYKGNIERKYAKNSKKEGTSNSDGVEVD